MIPVDLSYLLFSITAPIKLKDGKIWNDLLYQLVVKASASTALGLEIKISNKEFENSDKRLEQMCLC